MIEKLKIGTRGSPLALKQTEMVIEALKVDHPDIEFETIVIKTSGDWKPEDGETPLPEDEGGKGQFAKEIEVALEAGVIDCGVHSAKDMPAFLPDGLQMEHYLPRSDPRDAVLCDACTSIADIHEGAIVGTCSPRRSAIILHRRPDLKIVPMRGNVHTRIMKLCSGKVDVTLLAMAGLERLGLDQGTEHGNVNAIPPEVMLPACGQGAVGIEIKQSRNDLKALFDGINCADTSQCVSAERAVLKILNGSCHTPIAAHAIVEADEMYLRALVASLDGTQMYFEEGRANRNDGLALGRQIGEKLKVDVPPELLA
ncbi:MAG: hydroxymethylbilane synthase [Pseudomonadota bacterium]